MNRVQEATATPLLAGSSTYVGFDECLLYPRARRAVSGPGFLRNSYKVWFGMLFRILLYFRILFPTLFGILSEYFSEYDQSKTRFEAFGFCENL